MNEPFTPPAWMRGKLTRAEFLQIAPPPKCPHCAGETSMREMPPDSPHAFAVVCEYCRRWRPDDPPRHLRWLRKDENGHVKRREEPPDGKSTAEVWELFEQRCVCCGIQEAEMKIFGVSKTAQHVGQYRLKGHDTDVVPFCSACQAFATAQHHRIQAALRYIAKLKPLTEWKKSAEDA